MHRFQRESATRHCSVWLGPSDDLASVQRQLLRYCYSKIIDDVSLRLTRMRCSALLPTPFGTFWLAPNSLVLDTGITPGGGLRTVSFVLPPTFRGVPLVLQPITTLTTGQLVIGPATTVVLN